MMSASSRFTRIYESLPPQTREALVHKHLIPLLDTVPSKKIISAASRRQKRCDRIPVLDLHAKRRELARLLDELERDTKKAFMKERSNMNEILYEIVDSLTNWIGDIWITLFEYRVNFSHVHDCLIFIAGVLDRVSNETGGCCKCFYMNLYIPVLIKDKNGQKIKSFHLNGAQTLNKVLLWIWRELFLVMLASGSDQDEDNIPIMLRDIEDAFGWESFERMLMGGKMPFPNHEGDDNWEDESIDATQDDDDDDGYEDEDDEACACPFHAEHWSREVGDQMLPLRKLVKSRLRDIFKCEPSLRLYACLIAISIDGEATEAELVKDISHIATSGSETYAAALQIHSLRDCAKDIVSLLDSHSYLLRPQDAPILQTATICISRNPLFRSRGLRILEKELLDTVRSIRAAITPCFVKIDERHNREEVIGFLALRSGTQARKDRLAHWIEVVTTPIQAPHPVALAAYMMGFPVGPEEADSEDPFGVMNLDEDPDLEELREEFRPKLKQRFEGWTNTAVVIKTGSALLIKVFKEIIDWMPYLNGNDVVEEMIGRLADRPSKLYICDALDALLAFVKVQRRRSQKKRKMEPPPKSGRGFTSLSASSRTADTPTPPQSSTVFGDMEGVD